MIVDQIKTTFKFHDIQSLSNNGDIIDLTKDQYETNELVGVYSTGKKRGYYGSKEAPAGRFFRLMQRVQPTSNLYEINSLREIKSYQSYSL